MKIAGRWHIHQLCLIHLERKLSWSTLIIQSFLLLGEAQELLLASNLKWDGSNIPLSFWSQFEWISLNNIICRLSHLAIKWHFWLFMVGLTTKLLFRTGQAYDYRPLYYGLSIISCDSSKVIEKLVGYFHMMLFNPQFTDEVQNSICYEISYGWMFKSI